MRINMAAQAVRSAYILGEIQVFDLSSRSSQKASFAVDCAEEDYPAFAAALQGSGCRLLNESYKVAEVVEVVPDPYVLQPNEAVLVTFPNGSMMIGVAEEVEVDLSVLDLSIGKLGEALATGDYDDQLDALLAAEEAGKTRKGAVAALKARMESL
jgi:hypothetical protein